MEGSTQGSLDDGTYDGISYPSMQVGESFSPLAFISEITHWTPTEYTALIHAFVASFSVIMLSELGDKTFIITAIMAMKNSRLLVLFSSACALLLMTVLSVGMGVAVTVIPKIYTHYVSIALFLCFGLKMLKEAYDMQKEGDETEFDEIKRDLEEQDFDAVGQQSLVTDGSSPSVLTTPKVEDKSNLWLKFTKTVHIAPIVIKIFTMVFVAEWGDRSQISTVILAAREDVIGVFVGSFAGHFLCTGLAVIGGRFAATMISIRTMTILGGIIFLFFAAFAVISGVD